MEKATLACLRFWAMAHASQRMGIHQHRDVLKIQNTLKTEFMNAMRFVYVSQIN